MAPGLRKLALTAHVTSSAGWIGAVVASLALGVVGLTSEDAQLVRAVYLTMEPLGGFVLIPMSIASLLTGLIVSLGTSWGLFRHYWVIVKLLMNLVATVILLLYMATLSYFADVAAASSSSGGGLGALRSQSPLIHAAGALVLLLVATTLSVYKPRGMTRHGQRTQPRRLGRPSAAPATDHGRVSGLMP